MSCIIHTILKAKNNNIDKIKKALDSFKKTF